MFSSEEKRFELFARVLVAGFLLSIAFAKSLWLSERLYPLAPVANFFPAFQHPFDAIVLGILCALLIFLFIRPHSRHALVSILVFICVLFIQDGNRMWPSFYEYFFLLLALVASRPLNMARFVVAAVYFWSGVQKLTPHFFSEQFPWVLEPLTNYIHVAPEFLYALGVCAALVEISIGVALLTKQFRFFGLVEALLFIGPLRSWNDSAWIWNLVSAALVFVLFFRAQAFSWKELVPHWQYRSAIIPATIILFIGLLPLLNNFNLWPSPLSFNVYTGNISSATIMLDTRLSESLAPELKMYTRPVSGVFFFDLTRWSADEFNAAPVPTGASFESAFFALCAYNKDASGTLIIKPKSNWFVSTSPKIYSCSRS